MKIVWYQCRVLYYPWLKGYTDEEKELFSAGLGSALLAVRNEQEGGFLTKMYRI